MLVQLVPSQTGPPTSTPLPYTGNPFLLCWDDVLLFSKHSWSIIGILLPLKTSLGGPLDELHPSARNLFCVGLHGFLIIFQLAFLISLPFLTAVFVWTALLYVVVVMLVNLGLCWILNGNENFLKSKVNIGDEGEDNEDECWIFLNGVATGKHWLQANIDRLSLTFRRPVIGVHNRTYGIIFDLIQCIIERNFVYPTLDIRNSYLLIKERLLQDHHKKVILLLHSQGGIEGGMILDWLLSELPHDTLQKLEIYTFGSAANHFNNPHRTSSAMKASQTETIPAPRNDKAVRHIEHYASDTDFVARWGVLAFHHTRNRYMGRIFIRSGMGHLLNQHYLNSMFPLDKAGRVVEKNGFMDQEVIFSSAGAVERAREGSPVEPVSLRRAESVLRAEMERRKSKVRDFSRLWEYRNGGKPDY
ncbi:hypothetical protein P154DRAFT_546248 [Amniculicola lignicola CBS 123094]|uniref:DUF676 domain-containing protein n=1 Tax=Amniculicola lignicola CBS 123094 TaxID=1392246 RepID=A0A6A5WEE0_9PLEO|nr:hypothetical protein P154DRAFT_546248 [Amniculicola lignicola CBS 123094]